jgi:single-stranded DNA-binding protein
MGDKNYFGGVIKILETPKKKDLKNNHILVSFRAQLPQYRKNRIVKLVVWGKLAKDVISYYKKNDYILIEGYVSIRPKVSKINKISVLNKRIQKQVEISAFKIYPFILNYNRVLKKN